MNPYLIGIRIRNPAFFSVLVDQDGVFAGFISNFFLRQFRIRSRIPAFQKDKYFLVENVSFVRLMNDPEPGPGAKTFGNAGSGSVMMKTVNAYCTVYTGSF